MSDSVLTELLANLGSKVHTTGTGVSMLSRSSAALVGNTYMPTCESEMQTLARTNMALRCYSILLC